MRTLLNLFILLAISIFIFSCRGSKKVSKKKIKVDIEKDSTTRVLGASLSDSINELENLKVEFADLLIISKDSIRDIPLYKFIKDNLGKKCIGIKHPEYTCESFLSTLLKKVYKIDFPGNIDEQMKSKQVELYKNYKFLEKGDILFFNYSARQPDRISHTGFYLQNGYFVMASYKEGVVISKFQNGYWDKRFVAAGRVISNFKQ
jgi:NlpC/P60 family